MIFNINYIEDLKIRILKEEIFTLFSIVTYFFLCHKQDIFSCTTNTCKKKFFYMNDFFNIELF